MKSQFTISMFLTFMLISSFVFSQHFFANPQSIGNNDLAGPEAIQTVDLDGDGDNDILVASGGNGSIVWFENLDGLGTYDNGKIIAQNLHNVMTINVNDLDGDGDMDISYGSWNLNEIAWLKNIDGKGNFGDKMVIDSYAAGSWRIRSCDFDGDNDVDLMATLREAGSVVWYENTDGQGAYSDKIIIKSDMHNPRDLYPADFDGDGDLDVAACDWYTGEIFWFENLDGKGNTSPALNVFDLADRINKLGCADMNKDGLVDIIGHTDYDMFWMENLGNYTWGPKQNIANEDGIGDFIPVDLNYDGNIDVLSTVGYNGEICVYVNNGNSFQKVSLFETDWNGFDFIDAEDINGDGIVDLIGAGWAGSSVSWFDLANGVMDVGQEMPVFKPDAAAPFEMEKADLDQDGDNDIVAISMFDGKIGVFPNSFYRDDFYEDNITIAENIITPSSLCIKDFDGDGVEDILVSNNGGDLMWSKNKGNNQYDPLSTLTSWSYGTSDIYAADLDNDGDNDILSCSKWEKKLVWFENDGAGNIGPAVQISDQLDGAEDIVTADLDNDGDQDILVASTYDDKVSLFYNNGNKTFQDEVILEQDLNGPKKVITGDLDMDGDLDVITCAYDQIRWYENLNPNFSGFKLISGEWDYLGWVSDISLADTDNDGDLDVFASLEDAGKLVWYENLNDSDEFLRDFNRDIVQGLNEPRSIINDDIDMDGKMDVASVSYRDNKIQWYRNEEFPVFLSQPQDQSFCETGTAIFMVEVDKWNAYQWQMADPYTEWYYDIGDENGFTGTKSAELRYVFDNNNLNQAKFRCIIGYENMEFVSDPALLTVNNLIEANAGEDQEICGDMTYVHGSWPGSGVGSWSILEGSVDFDDPSLDYGLITNIQSGINILKWTILNGECSSEDVVQIIRFDSVFVTVPLDNIQLPSTENEAVLSIITTGDIESYQWYKDGQLLTDDTHISGANTATLTISGPLDAYDTGNYYCIVVGKCNTVYTPDIYLEILITNLQELDGQLIKVFPNPTSSSAILTSLEEMDEYWIIDSKGRILSNVDVKSKQLKIILNSFTPGIYTIQVRIQDEISKHKLIVIPGI